ncbi:MAG: tRNA (adenosine(37)-N6)-threonylcarbamoyltransferase complex dimerization subunit type 1 TsaB [Clostridia bacterium]|nr:tRNA (adenosine(37)-N6)-threonylcarbamoyltransferase complex dimerization subunit type 1 TsaB [Clostridia bacterium]
MKILALDSTAQVATVALCEDERLLGEYTINNGNTHSETLLPMVESILQFFSITPADVDLFAISAGPGSFTGVRIGAATVKGLAFAHNKPCVGVSTLEALAYNLIGTNGLICPVMNARRKQVYTALFRCKDGIQERLLPDSALSIEELDGILKEYSSESISLCGDGYAITNQYLTTRTTSTPERLRHQSAYSVAQIALKQFRCGENLSTDTTLAPTYLRPSQAERERLEREGITQK